MGPPGRQTNGRPTPTRRYPSRVPSALSKVATPGHDTWQDLPTAARQVGRTLPMRSRAGSIILGASHRWHPVTGKAASVMALLGWKVVHGGQTPPPGAVVRPDERLSWPRTIGLGAQHVVAMFGATFVFPIVMG